MRLNKLSYAEDTYRKAISLRLDLFVAQANLGCVLTSLGKLREGQAALTKAANLDPSSELAFFDLGFVRQLQDNHPGAAKAYARALELRPDYVEARNNLGNTLTALGQFDEALVLFDGVIALRPDDARAYFNRGYLLARVGKFDEARKNYRAAIEHMPGYFEAYYNIAHGLCYEQGKFDEAATELEKNLKLVSSLPAEKTRWLRLIAECRRLRSLDQQLSDLLRSGARPRERCRGVRSGIHRHMAAQKTVWSGDPVL